MITLLKKVFLFLSLLFFSACHRTQSPTSMKTNNCFNPENYTTVENYIAFRLSVSGMGKYYLEYPVPTEIIKDEKPGNKKLPVHPENVYDIYIDKSAKQLVFENKPAKFIFDPQKGFLNQDQKFGEKESSLADDIFCHLLKLAEKK